MFYFLFFVLEADRGWEGRRLSWRALHVLGRENPVFEAAWSPKPPSMTQLPLADVPTVPVPSKGHNPSPQQLLQHQSEVLSPGLVFYRDLFAWLETCPCEPAPIPSASNLCLKRAPKSLPSGEATTGEAKSPLDKYVLPSSQSWLSSHYINSD